MKTWEQLRDEPTLRNHYATRSRVVKAIRDFFWKEGFLEVETPQLVNLPSMEPNIEVFETDLRDNYKHSYRAFLTSSPEFAMKKLLAGGYENIFQICKSYRNEEGWSSRHNPEFTILEWYRTDSDYTAIMRDCENMFRFIGKQLGKTRITFHSIEYDLTQKWERISVAEAFQLYSEIDTDTLLSPDLLKKAAEQKGYSLDEENTCEEAFNQIFLNEIEPHLGRTKPTILYDYPVEMASLSRRKTDDPRFAERFEFYIAGLELGNAFSELTDWQEQLTRLKADRTEKEKLGRTLYDFDRDFIDALESGVEDCAGIAVGVDRVAMFFMNADTIQDTLFFPAIEMWKPKEE